jgi:general secretion pathway protein L
MSAFADARILFSRWTETVAGAICSLLDRFNPRSQVQLIENEDESFTLHAMRSRKGTELPDRRIRISGDAIAETLPAPWAAQLRTSRVQLLLQPGRFLVRPLELPKRATEFLDGIVRSQIDRLTPWTASQAVYGWTPAEEASADKIQMNIVAAARAAVVPLVRAAQTCGVESVVVSTKAPDSKSKPALVDVLEQRSAAMLRTQRVHKIVTAVFIFAAAISAVSVAGSIVLGGILDDRASALSRQIAQRRAALRIGQNAGDSALSQLKQRKHEDAASVLVLETLSRLLPDDTYVTELRIDGNKMQLIGITQDAPALIGILEQSSQFKSATFFAPTTRGANDPGERFHIEAHIKPEYQAGL